MSINSSDKMLKSDQLSSQVLDHLGLIKAIIDKLSLEKEIDKLLPVSQEKGSKVTMGERVSAMILNGLGFIDDRLYMFPEFLSNKPVDRLFRPGIEASNFNDDALGRCLDAIYEYGTTKLFCELAFKIGKKFNLLGKTAHFDTTSITLYGDYKQETETEQDSKSATVPKHSIPAYGYSKDGRSDLKQMILLLATTGKSNLPIFTSAHSGNASDKTTIPEAIERAKSFAASLSVPSDFLYIGDSAMYENSLHQTGHYWLTRVPHSLKQAKQVLGYEEEELAYREVGAGYEGYQVSRPLEITYKGVKQRWIVVYSKQKHDRDQATLTKKISREEETTNKAIWHLSNQLYNCKQDAHKIIRPITKKLNYHTLDYQLEAVYSYNQAGRPGKEAKQELKGYQIVSVQLTREEKVIKQEKARLGKFILATNQLNEEKLPATILIKEYKDQHHIERGFAFIKGDAFEVSSIFLKTPSRISALMMVMSLCLLVYNLSAYFLHSQLESNKETLPNQLNKGVQNPSMSYIYRKLQGIHVVYLTFGTHQQEIVSNLDPLRCRIIRYFGDRAAKIYGLSV